MRIVLAFLLGLLILPIFAFVYLHFGHPPVAVADQPFPMEKQIVHVPLNARINAEMPKNPPIEANEATFVAGATIYREQCAVCHGTFSEASVIGKHMYPSAPHLWGHHGKDVVGVSDDPPGETYWKVANGLRLTGMPSFDKTLTENEMWQVTLLLANADKPMPDSVTNVLKPALNFNPPATGAVAVPTAPVPLH
jgi:thiosulfate dehydrogenase